MRRVTLVILALVLALGAVRQACAQDRVVMRPLVVLEGWRAITLGDVADVTGAAGSGTLAALVLIDRPEPDASGVVRVTPGMVREALEHAPGVNLGRLTLSGGVTVLRARPSATVGNGPSVEAIHRVQPPSGRVREAIIERLAQSLGLTASDVRISFDDAAAALLDTPVAGRTVALHPSGAGERVSVSVRVFEGERIVASGSVRTQISVRRRVAVTTGAAERGTRLTPSMVRVEERWMAPDVRPARVEDVLASQLRSGVEGESVVLARHIEAPVVIRRGEMVSVDCLSGGVVLRATARALSAGVEGQVIEFKVPGADRTFTARVAGPGRAVAVAGAPSQEDRP